MHLCVSVWLSLNVQWKLVLSLVWMKSSAVVRTFTQTSENTVDYYTTLRTNPSHNSPRSFWHRIYKPDTFQLDSNPGFWSFYDKNEWFCSWTFQNTFNLIPDHHRVCSYLWFKKCFYEKPAIFHANFWCYFCSIGQYKGGMRQTKDYWVRSVAFLGSSHLTWSGKKMSKTYSPVGVKSWSGSS